MAWNAVTRSDGLAKTMTMQLVDDPNDNNSSFRSKREHSCDIKWHKDELPMNVHEFTPCPSHHQGRRAGKEKGQTNLDGAPSPKHTKIEPDKLVLTRTFVANQNMTTSRSGLLTTYQKLLKETSWQRGMAINELIFVEV